MKLTLQTLLLLLLLGGCALPIIPKEGLREITPECPCYEGKLIGHTSDGWDVYEDCECVNE